MTQTLTRPDRTTTHPSARLLYPAGRAARVARSAAVVAVWCAIGMVGAVVADWAWLVFALLALVVGASTVASTAALRARRIDSDHLVGELIPLPDAYRE